MPVLSLAELLGAVDRSELSVLHGRDPLVLVAPRPGSPEESTRAATALRTAPTVTVLVDDPAATGPEIALAADVCLTDVAAPPRPWVHGSVDGLAGPIADHGEAALALVALLRATEDLDVWPAIATEAATYAMLLAADDHRRWLTRQLGSDPNCLVGPSGQLGSDPNCRVLVERDGGVLRVVLDRAEKRNALDRAMRDELVAALDLAHADPTIERVQLTGAGPDFCAGGDLAEFGTTTNPAVAFAVRLAVHPGAAVHRVADRVTATLHGKCIGAGIEIPAFADHVIARPDVRIALPELSMGLVPGAGGTASIPRRIGRQRTAWLALTGSVLDASTALAWGLVDEVVDGTAAR